MSDVDIEGLAGQFVRFLESVGTTRLNKALMIQFLKTAPGGIASEDQLLVVSEWADKITMDIALVGLVLEGKIEMSLPEGSEELHYCNVPDSD
jgi:hypothetical protein